MCCVDLKETVCDSTAFTARREANTDGGRQGQRRIAATQKEEISKFVCSGDP